MIENLIYIVLGTICVYLVIDRICRCMETRALAKFFGSSSFNPLTFAKNIEDITKQIKEFSNKEKK